MAKLNEDFPHYAVLEAAGVTTEAQLARYADDYTQIPGIGPSFAKDIEKAMAAGTPPAKGVEPQPRPPAEPRRSSGKPARFCYTADTIFSGLAYEQKDGTWDIELENGQRFQNVRKVDDRPRVPGEFQLTQAASAG